jgi:hypothetical protein
MTFAFMGLDPLAIIQDVDEVYIVETVRVIDIRKWRPPVDLGTSPHGRQCSVDSLIVANKKRLARSNDKLFARLPLRWPAPRRRK